MGLTRICHYLGKKIVVHLWYISDHIIFLVPTECPRLCRSGRMHGKPEQCTQRSQGQSNSLSEWNKESTIKLVNVTVYGFGLINALDWTLRLYFQRLSTSLLVFRGSKWIFFLGRAIVCNSLSIDAWKFIASVSGCSS